MFPIITKLSKRGLCQGPRIYLFAYFSQRLMLDAYRSVRPKAILTAAL